MLPHVLVLSKKGLRIYPLTPRFSEKKKIYTLLSIAHARDRPIQVYNGKVHFSLASLPILTDFGVNLPVDDVVQQNIGLQHQLRPSFEVSLEQTEKRGVGIFFQHQSVGPDARVVRVRIRGRQVVPRHFAPVLFPLASVLEAEHERVNVPEKEKTKTTVSILRI